MTVKMKAMVHTKYGSPDVLQLTDVEKPTPKANEILVKVVATAVNQADNHLLSGMLRFGSGLLKPKHPILGSEITGRVEAVGQDGSLGKAGNVLVSRVANVDDTLITLQRQAAVAGVGEQLLDGLR
jgi:NADPH:quinone reductase-like Zn-dependent oxidoreductase